MILTYYFCNSAIKINHNVAPWFWLLTLYTSTLTSILCTSDSTIMRTIGSITRFNKVLNKIYLKRNSNTGVFL